MTNEEAINDLKEISDDYLLNHFITPNNRESLRMSISALEKQTPKKVRYEDVGYNMYRNVNTYACICPSCELNIIEFDDGDLTINCGSDDIEDMFHANMKHDAYCGLNTFCNRCGQALDWSDK